MPLRAAKTLLVLLLAAPVAAAQPAAPARTGAVVLAGAMPEPDLVALGVMTAAALPDADFLLDSPHAEPAVKEFLTRLRPAAVATTAPATSANGPWTGTRFATPLFVLHSRLLGILRNASSNARNRLTIVEAE